MRKVFLISFALFAINVFSQITLSVQNPSFEGMPAETITPTPWDNCNFGLTPDTQPGFFGVNAAPHDGNTYLGLVNDINSNWQEGAGQVLSSPMIAGQTYTFSVWMQQSNSVQFSNDPVELEIYGGWSHCDQAELLAFSGAVVIGTWTEYTFSFTPADNYTDILLLSRSINTNGGERPYLLVDDMSIIVPCEINIDSAIIENTSCGLNNGSINIFADASYTYEWSTGQNTSSISNLDSSTYSVTVSLAGGTCFWDTTITINSSEELIADNNITNVSCFGLSDGEISIAPTNGNAPFSYNWSNGNTSNTNLNLTTGSYFVTITDSLNCLFTDILEITEPSILELNINSNNATCFGSDNGSANANITGGTSPYIYNWSSGADTENAENLIAGNYTLTVTDANSCTIQSSTIINQANQIELIFSSTDLQCFGDNNGTIQTTINGGTPTYSFAWDNGANTQNIENLIGGLYTVTVTDASTCSVTGSVEIATVSEPIQILYTTQDNICFGDDNGIINTSVTGGTPPYSYDWGHDIHDENLANLYSATYLLTVSDANNCTANMAIPIIEPNKLITSLPENTTICKNTDLLIQTSTSGGTTPYQYYWSTGNVVDNITINISDSAFYNITVTDANNCTATDQMQVKTFGLPQLISTVNKDTVCPGNPIVITSSVIGGANPYTYTINGDIANLEQIVYPYQENTYPIQVIDACGNTDNAQVYIYTYNIPTLAISSDVLNGCPPLTVNFNEGSNLSGAIYNWTFGNINENNYTGTSNPTHIFNNSGTYDVSLEIVTEQGCRVQQTITDMITVFPKPEAMFEATPDVVSFIEPSVEFINYSTHNYNNYWYFGDGDMSNLANPVHNYQNISEYQVMLVVESEHACADTVYSQITVKDEFTLYVPTAFSPDKDGINDGFKAVGHGIDLDNYYMAVYNRWGEKIWESTDLSEEWKGTAKNGTQTVQNGTYKWIVVCKDFRGVEYTKSGNVTVIR